MMAKLVPAGSTAGAPSKWVNYLVTTVPTVSAPTPKPTGPTTDGNGMLVGAGDGTYTYTFYTDVTKAAATLAAWSAANANADVSALGDVSYQPSLRHRMVIEFFGNARGTGIGSHANTPDGSNGTVNAEMTSPINVIYDWIPATGAAPAATDASREIVNLAVCDTCHTKLAYHGGHRTDPKNCVTCHTDQRKYGFQPSTRAALAFTSADTENVNGTSEFDFPQVIHQLHMGDQLQMANHDIAVDSTILAQPGGTPVNMITYPQSIANCTTCHVASTATPQAGNWDTVPTRAACGGCHDSVDFTSPSYTAGNHAGGQQLDDSKCVLCHVSTTTDLIATYHVPAAAPDPTNAGLSAAQGGVASNSHTNSSWVDGNPSNLPPGAIATTWNLMSVSVNATRQPVWTFQIMQGGKAVVLNTFNVAGPVEMMNNFVGGPNLYMVFAVPQDGITAPADYNASVSVNLHKLWRGAAAAGSTLVANADGSYTATLAGVTVPTSASMIAGGVGYFYGVVANASIAAATTPALAAALTDSLPLTQTNVAGYPYSATTYQGGLAVPAPNVWMPAAGQAVRRSIVAQANCETCHKNLGVFTNSVFHDGQRNNAPSCTFCHNTLGVDDGWGYNIKEVVHSLHASSKRTTPFTWQASHQYWNLTYPALLNNCEACHLPGTYDLSANAAAVPNLLWTTIATGTFTGSTLATPTSAYSATTTYLSPAVTSGVNYGSGFSVNTGVAAKNVNVNTSLPVAQQTVVSQAVGATVEADPTTLVNSPIASACYACHDTKTAAAHMINNGGTLGSPRSTVATSVAGVNTVAIGSAPAVTEQCLVCHGTGAMADIKVVHMNF